MGPSSIWNAPTISNITMSSVKVEGKPEPKVASKKTPPGNKNVRYPFWFGGSSSCFAACVTHPLDLVKVLSLPTHAQSLELIHPGPSPNPHPRHAQIHGRNVRARLQAQRLPRSLQRSQCFPPSSNNLLHNALWDL